MELKKIGIGVMVNDNDEGEVAMMPAAEVDELVALYNKALQTILVGIEEEDHHLTFDPWLKEQNPALYDKAMNAFMEEYNTRMSCEPMYDDKWEMANKYASHYRDIDGVYLDDSNDVKIYRFSCE